MDEQTVNEAPIFEASDFDSVANEPVAEQAEEIDSSAVEETNEQTDSQEEAIEQPADSSDTEEAQTGDAIDEFLAKKVSNLMTLMHSGKSQICIATPKKAFTRSRKKTHSSNAD